MIYIVFPEISSFLVLVFLSELRPTVFCEGYFKTFKGRVIFFESLSYRNMKNLVIKK